MSNLIPARMTYEDLANILDDMVTRIRAGDSFEGNIEYTMDYDNEDPLIVLVSGLYRIGNLQGQGGMRMIGTVPGATEAADPEAGTCTPECACDPAVVKTCRCGYADPEAGT